MAAQTPTSNPKKFKVLFVDNSRTTRFAMSQLFIDHGYDVDTAATGMEAIEKVKNGTFDIAVMDLYMPLMNGYEAARHIRALPDPRCKDIPIIALTASQDPKDIDISKNSGMNEYLIKSLDNQPLLDVIEKYKNKKAS